MLKKLITLVVPLLLFMLITNFASAAPPLQALGGEEYTVQAGDWLSKIAEKYYGESVKYLSIVEATNAKATEDDSFAAIPDPNLIYAGQKLWVPNLNEPDVITVRGIPFQPTPIEALGIQTVVPRNWPAVENDNPLFAHSWSAGIFSIVSFTTMPGNDALVGLARLLGVPRSDLTSGFTGGELTEENFGDRTWTIFTREEGGISTVVGATIQDKVIYQIRLFAETSQKETILSTILDNFEITDPTLVQQQITIEAPAAGLNLTNPFELRGTTNQYPFKGRLVYRVLDAKGNQVGQSPFEVMGSIGSSASFAIPAIYGVDVDGPGTVEVAEISEADGTIITIDSVAVQLVADPPGYAITIDDPFFYTNVSSPVQIRGKTNDRPFEGRLNYRIVDASGEVISRGLLQASGQVGRVNLFDGFAEFNISNDGPGRIEVFDIRPADGAVFSISTVNVWLTKSQ